MENLLSNEYVKMVIGVVLLAVYVIKVVPFIVSRLEQKLFAVGKRTGKNVTWILLLVLVILVAIGVAIFRFFMGESWWESMGYFE